MNHKIRALWMKGRNIKRLFCDSTMLIKLKEKFYKIVIRVNMLYGAKCWVFKK